MSITKEPMTVEGEQALKDELTRLKTEDRPNVIAAIAEARSHGDLKENAEYHAAKEQQSFIEGRIAEVEGKLSRSQVIDITSIENTGKVIFGTTITLFNHSTESEVVYKIVGEDEADFKTGKISVTSPLARAAIGKHEEDVFELRAPGGDVEYEVLKIEHI